MSHSLILDDCGNNPLFLACFANQKISSTNVSNRGVQHFSAAPVSMGLMDETPKSITTSWTLLKGSWQCLVWVWARHAHLGTFFYVFCLSERGGEPWLTQQCLMTLPGSVSTEAVLLMGCLQSFPSHSWPQSEMKTKKMMPRGLSIFLSYKLLVPLSRRSSQCPVYSVLRLQCLPTLTHCMEKNQPSLDLSLVPLAETGKVTAGSVGQSEAAAHRTVKGGMRTWAPSGSMAAVLNVCVSTPLGS